MKSNRHHFLWFLSNLLFIPALFFLKFYALQWLFSPVQSHSQLKKAAKMSQRTMHWYYNNYHFRNYTRVDSMSIWPELLASMTYFREKIYRLIFGWSNPAVKCFKVLLVMRICLLHFIRFSRGLSPFPLIN